MQLFYHPVLETEDNSIEFGADESRHISRVLRKKKGDQISVTNGRGMIFTAVIDSIDKKKCICRVTERKRESPLPYYLHLAVAPTKLNDRFEWFLEKATEIGISEITPLLCDRSERKVLKMERMERILQSAMKQSLTAYLPRLNEMMPFSDFIQLKPKQEFKGIAHCDNGVRKGLGEVLKEGTDACLLIGPEGDCSQEEIELALSQGYEAIKLGDRRLRTETAAIVAVHTVAFINEYSK